MKSENARVIFLRRKISEFLFILYHYQFDNCSKKQLKT